MINYTYDNKRYDRMTTDTSFSLQSQSFIDFVQQQFISPLSPQRLLSLSSALLKSYIAAASTSRAQMLPSHITTLPSGRERGQYLAVDFGGTNMRVALVRLENKEAWVEKLEKWTIPEAVKTGTATEFFTWIAERIVNLAGQSQLDQDEYEWKLGVTWSFPFAQKAVNRGTIHQMGKGFNIPSILNASLTDLLHDALESLHPPHPIRVTALLNDAVATLLSHAFTRPMTRMGLICGTGTNATCLCPIEYLSKEKYHHEDGVRAWEKFVLVNTEWSMFGRGVLPVTEYDRIVDEESAMPGFQPFEQMVSGRYIGEVVRLVCLDGITKRAWSFDSIPEGWNMKWGLHTATCSLVESTADISKIIAILNKVHPLTFELYTSEDAYLFKQICVAVSTRSAYLVAASTIALLQVNDELSKYPIPTAREWCNSTSSGTPSPSDSGLGSMDEEIRWSRRGSIFSVQGSRRGSLASPTLPSFPSKPMATDEQPQITTIIQENGIVTEEPGEMNLDEDDDDVVVVAFCGSVMEKYYTFRSRCQSILDQLVQQPPLSETNGINGRLRKVAAEQRRVVLEENRDGGILGAGILAAVMDARELSASFA